MPEQANHKFQQHKHLLTSHPISTKPITSIFYYISQTFLASKYTTKIKTPYRSTGLTETIFQELKTPKKLKNQSNTHTYTKTHQTNLKNRGIPSPELIFQRNQNSSLSQIWITETQYQNNTETHIQGRETERLEPGLVWSGRE
jgi:hypothetical protein